MSGNSTNLTAPAGADIDVKASLGTVAAGTSTAIKFVPDPTQPSITESYLQPPVSEGYIVYKVYAESALSTDGYVRSKINGVDQSTYFGPINQTVPTQYHIAKFQDKLITLGPLDKLTLYFVNKTATTAAVTLDMIVSYIRVPAGWKKNVPIPQD